MGLNCDRCGKEVKDLGDSCRELEYEMNCILVGPGEAAKREQVGPARERHIFKTNGCQGSPSRAQYLGGKLDTYEKYQLDPEFKPIIQAAHEKCKEKAVKIAGHAKLLGLPAHEGV